MRTRNWADFKTICITTKGLKLQYEELEGSYHILGPDANNITWEIELPKKIPDPGNPEQNIDNPDVADFLANVMALCNKSIVQFDSDGAPMSRVKVAPSGWNFNLRGIEFATSTIGSVVNKDGANSNMNDAVLTLLDANGDPITDQLSADSNCVTTRIDIEPPFDYYLAGGKLKFVDQPTADVRIAVIGVPDIPAAYGGSKHFVQNINLKFIPAVDGVNADGRAAKWLQYSASLHTNKIRFAVYHPAGHKMPIAVFLETYKQ